MAVKDLVRIYLAWLPAAVMGILVTLAPSAPGRAEEVQVHCLKHPPKPSKMGFKDTYKDVPFKPGEKAKYEVTWGGLLAGYSTLEVRKPQRLEGVWHRVFHMNASTGDWFKAIFVAKEAATAYSRPWDFGVTKFYMEQNEGKLFSLPFVQKKWLDFDHEGCKVNERTVQPGKNEKRGTFDLAYGAIDALGVVFHLRTKTYEIGKKVRAPVYTSEKNWWLEAQPLAIEKVTVPAGTFEAVKLKLETFLGKDLQQKGDVYAWIATKHPARPLVQLQGEIKIGSVWIKLHQLKEGG